jgi:DNA-directed RNA polymerase specialized sigma24 family protein
MNRRLVLRALFDENVIEPLVRRTLAGEARAWQGLWLAVDPAIEEMAGRFWVTGRLAEREDERRDVVIGVMERLQANDFERLGPFLGALVRRDGSARSWLSTVTRCSALNHARGHAENLGGRERRWAELVPLPDDIEDLLPVSVQAIHTIEAHRIQAYAARVLPEAQGKALCLWLPGYDDEEIAVRLGLAGAPAARRLIRAAIETLRRRFLRDDERRAPNVNEIDRAA